MFDAKCGKPLCAPGGVFPRGEGETSPVTWTGSEWCYGVAKVVKGDSLGWGFPEEKLVSLTLFLLLPLGKSYVYMRMCCVHSSPSRKLRGGKGANDI